jgi:hypothetical protein
MNTRFRLLLIGIGALLVTATFTFPLWYELIQPEDELHPFPELSEAQREVFDTLPLDRRADYIALRQQDANLALRMLNASLRPDVVVPDDEQSNPQLQGQVEVRRGTFIEITPNRSAEGTVTIYELPDGSRYLWLDDFSVVQGPGLRLFLSRANRATLTELAAADDPAQREYLSSINDLALDPLRANVGSQAYDVPREADLSQYNSVLIYSTDLDLLYSMAPLN